MPPAERLSIAQRLDAACERFEADWRAGKSPRIEDALAPADGADADALFRALLAVELELRVKNRERVTSAEYKARFPDRVDAVIEVFRAMAEKRKPGSGDTSVIQESIKEEAATLAPRPKPVIIQPGQSQIARFVLTELLGEGAFGQVFRARDPNLDRDVAIKTPRPGVINNEADRERFLREARALATVQHPNVCPVYEVGESDGRLYTVMAFVSGKTLAEAIKERKTPMPERQAALIVRKFALALEAAHVKGVIHRDLKPSNIMFDRERKDVVVMDFGLARRAAAIESELTLSGFVLGTPAYMAPEQAKGDIKSVGPCSDIYSLGVILYELLAGRRPFSGAAGEVIGKVQHVEPEPPSKWRADIDPKLEAICRKAMAKDPAQRYASMGQFAAALTDWLKSSPSREGEAPAEPLASGSAGASPSRSMSGESDESIGLQQVFAVLSDQRKQTVAAVEAAVKKFRPPMWMWLAGAGFTGLVAVLGIIFFARTPTATILINVGVDLNDKSLSFVLDGKPISAEELAKPIELKVGEHDFVVWRGSKVEKHLLLTVRGGRNPGFEYRPVEPPEPPISNPSEGFTLLFNGKDLTGWQEETPNTWRVENRELIGRHSETGDSWLISDREFRDYVLRCEFLKDGALTPTTGVALRAPAVGVDTYQQKLRVVLGSSVKNLNDIALGSLIWSRKIRSRIDPKVIPSIAENDWNTAEIELRGSHLRVAINDTVILQQDLAALADGADTYRQLKRVSGRIGVNSQKGVMRYRRIEVKELTGSASVAAVPPSPVLPEIPMSRGNVPTPQSYLNHPPGLIWSTPAGTTWWWCACFSPRGDFVAAGEDPRTPGAPGYQAAQADKNGFNIRIWPIRDGQMGNDSFVIRHQGGTKRWQTAMTVSPDGRYLASADGTGSINLFNMDATTPTRLASFQRFDGVITALAFSEDGRYFAAAARKVGSLVVVWDLSEPTKPKEAFTLAPKDQDEIASMIFSPDSQTLFVGGRIPGREGRLYAWTFRKDTEAKQLWSAPPGTGGPWVRSMDITPDGRELAIAYDDTAYLLDPGTGKVRLTLKGHAAGTSCQYVSFSRDGSRCLTAGYDMTVRFWSTKDGQQLWQNSAPSGKSEGAAISPDGRLAFTSSHISHEPSAGNSAQMWRLPDAPTEASGRPAPSEKPELVVLTELAAGQEKSGPWPSPDGLSLYWTEKPGGVMTLWRANRKSTSSPFEGAVRIGSGFDLTLSSDLTEMIFVEKAAGGKPRLHVRTKQRASDPQFSPARIINELKDCGLYSVSMSQDNLTLYGTEFVDAQKIWRPVRLHRAGRSQPWSQPEVMEFTGLPANNQRIDRHSVTADGKYLLGNHASSPSHMVVLSSSDGGKTFGNPMVIEVPGGGVTGKFPRYVAATRELFFGDDSSIPDKKLYIIRNFDPAACTTPLR